MMTKAKILASIEESLKYLKKTGIEFEETFKIKELSPSKYSEKYYNTFHEGNYEKTFVVAAENGDFDIRLSDGSFFQFTAKNEEDIHYSFFPRIEEILSFNQYVAKYLDEENADTIEQEYESYLSADKKPLNPCPIRYDVSKSEYKEGTHAYAHWHIGINTNIRIPSDKICKPICFVDFVVKNFYKKEWDNAYLHNQGFRRYVCSLKNQAEIIASNNFSEEERKLLFLT